MTNSNSALLALAERVERVCELSLLHRIPVPCPGGYIYLQLADLKEAATALRARSAQRKETGNDPQEL